MATKRDRQPARPATEPVTEPVETTAPAEASTPPEPDASEATGGSTEPSGSAWQQGASGGWGGSWQQPPPGWQQPPPGWGRGYAGYGPPYGAPVTERLYRSSRDKVFSGVCAGLAERFMIDPALVRIGWAVLTVLTGIFPFLLLYILWAIVVPEAPPQAYAGYGATPPVAPAGSGEAASGTAPDAAAATSPYASSFAAAPYRHATGNGAIVIGVLLIAVGAIFLLRQYVYIDWDVIWPLALVALGIIVLIAAYRPRRTT